MVNKEFEINYPLGNFEKGDKVILKKALIEGEDIVLYFINQKGIEDKWFMDPGEFKSIPVEFPPKPIEEILLLENYEEISNEQAIALIRSTKGKFFTVEFIKRTDGNRRILNGRLGVKAYLKGGTLKYNPEEKGLIPVFDVNLKQYRMIPKESIQALKISGKEYKVNKFLKEIKISLNESYELMFYEESYLYHNIKFPSARLKDVIEVAINYLKKSYKYRQSEYWVRINKIQDSEKINLGEIVIYSDGNIEMKDDFKNHIQEIKIKPFIGGGNKLLDLIKNSVSHYIKMCIEENLIGDDYTWDYLLSSESSLEYVIDFIREYIHKNNMLDDDQLVDLLSIEDIIDVIYGDKNLNNILKHIEIKFFLKYLEKDIKDLIGTIYKLYSNSVIHVEDPNDFEEIYKYYIEETIDRLFESHIFNKMDTLMYENNFLLFLWKELEKIEI